VSSSNCAQQKTTKAMARKKKTLDHPIMPHVYRMVVCVVDLVKQLSL
jgi:hypothetical protein